MPIATILGICIVTAIGGYLLRDQLFGKSSNAGWHRPNGQLTTRQGGFLRWILLLFAVTVLGTVAGPILGTIAAGIGSSVGFIAVLAAVAYAFYRLVIDPR